MDTSRSENFAEVSNPVKPAQTKPERWLCMATAFAIALELPLEDFLFLVGHDGSDILFPELPEPQCRRGHHIQECIDVAIKLNKTATPIELVPAIKGPKGNIIIAYGNSPQGNLERFRSVVENCRGVIEGQVPGGCFHALAFDRGTIINPDNGESYQYSQDAMQNRRFFPKCAWIVR